MTSVHGVIEHPESPRPTDYLYRVSIKCLIRNSTGEVLVVKEAGRDYWDLPGGGMDHNESLEQAIARELNEEVSLTGAFTYRILAAEDPAFSTEHNFWQLRLIFEVTPKTYHFAPGVDSDEVTFVDPLSLKESEHKAERLVYQYAQLA